MSRVTLRLLCGLTLLGLVQGWAGGNVIVTLKEGRNLPLLESFGYITGDVDTYVVFNAGHIKRRSSVASNSLAPVWEGSPGSGGQALNLGMHESGAKVTFQAWDADSGLEFGDDPIGGEVALSVPECWYGEASWEHVRCTDRREYFEGRWTEVRRHGEWKRELESSA